jgi:hypothetical protein
MLLRNTFALLFAISFVLYCAYLFEAKYRADHRHHSWDISDRNR